MVEDTEEEGAMARVRALRRQDGRMGSPRRGEGRREDRCGNRSHGKNEEDCVDILASWLFVKPKSRWKGKELGNLRHHGQVTALSV